MGYTRHHAVIVTGYDVTTGFGARIDIRRAHALAIGMFQGVAPVSPILDSPVNGYRTFVVGPDGSKEGWRGSDAGDAARDRFIAAIADSALLHFAEVVYQDDNPDLERITRRSGDDRSG